MLVKKEEMPFKSPLEFKTSNVMLGIYHCFGVCFRKEIKGDLEKHCVKLKWQSFLNKNKRQRNRGQWYYDEWLINCVRYCVFAFGYKLTYDVFVLMPKQMFPLMVGINDYQSNFYILIAPKKGWHEQKCC